MGQRAGHGLVLELARVPEMTGRGTERTDRQPWEGLTVTSCINGMAEPHSPHSRELPEEGMSSLSWEVGKQLLNGIC